LVFPVGQYGGLIRDDTPDRTWVSIRRGATVWSVEPAPGLVWLDTHGRLDALATTAWTRSAVLDRYSDTQRRVAEGAYAHLLGLELLAEIDPEGSEAEEFARTHQLVPSAHGMGNRSEDPSRFLAGFPPDQVATFTWHQRRLWRESHLEPSLWDGCLELVATEASAGRDLDARELLADTLRGLHVMLVIRLAYIDVAHPTGAAP
jgi:hypothetical protein